MCYASIASSCEAVGELQNMLMHCNTDILVFCARKFSFPIIDWKFRVSWWGTLDRSDYKIESEGVDFALEVNVKPK
jgi:hypothetical protein